MLQGGRCLSAVSWSGGCRMVKWNFARGAGNEGEGVNGEANASKDSGIFES